MSAENPTDYLEMWHKWEKENSLNAADNIREARERNWENPDYRQDRELRYAASRGWKELNEALKIAEAADKAERGENIEFEKHFEYTDNNDNYDAASVSDYEQLMDEFGFELADAALFFLKMTTAIETGFGSESYEPNLEGMAEALEHLEDTAQPRYEEATERINKLLNPESEGEIHTEVMKEESDKDEVAEYAETVVRELSAITTHLPKDLSGYVSEKIQYNIKQREIENMDADHPNPEPEFKRDFEKN